MGKNVLVIYSMKRFIASMLILLMLAAAIAGLCVYGHMEKLAKSRGTDLVSLSYSVLQI